MTQQSDARQLAAMLSLTFPGNKGVDIAAAKLRRLHEVNAQLLEALEQLHRATEGVSINDYSEETHDIAVSRARVAIAAAKEQA